MALIGADVHANGKQGSLIPWFGSPSGFVGSYEPGGDAVQSWAGARSLGAFSGAARESMVSVLALTERVSPPRRGTALAAQQGPRTPSVGRNPSPEPARRPPSAV